MVKANIEDALKFNEKTNLVKTAIVSKDKVVKTEVENKRLYFSLTEEQRKQLGFLRFMDGQSSAKRMLNFLDSRGFFKEINEQYKKGIKDLKNEH